MDLLCYCLYFCSLFFIQVTETGIVMEYLMHLVDSPLEFSIDVHVFILYPYSPLHSLHFLPLAAAYMGCHSFIINLPSLYLSLLSSYLLGGSVYKSSSKYGNNTPIKEPVDVWMEVNLQSSDPSQRTLHWFVGGTQQRCFFTHLPPSVQFAV